MIFLQIFFSEKNFAEDAKFNYSKTLCKNSILEGFKNISIENKEAYYETMETLWITLKEKWKMNVYNLRVLSCNFDLICSSLQDFMFYWKDWKTKWLNDSDKTVALGWLSITWSCPAININYNIFNSCSTRSVDDFNEIIGYCEKKKNEIYKKDYNDLEKDFKNDSKKDKVNFLSARIYDLNIKMRELIWNMTELKIDIVDISNRLVCTEK